MRRENVIAVVFAVLVVIMLVFVPVTGRTVLNSTTPGIIDFGTSQDLKTRTVSGIRTIFKAGSTVYFGFILAHAPKHGTLTYVISKHGKPGGKTTRVYSHVSNVNPTYNQFVTTFHSGVLNVGEYTLVVLDTGTIVANGDFALTS